jgi:hypothetical protein
MPGMDDAFRTIAIHDASPAAGAPACGACLHDTGRGPVCRAMADQPCQAPQLSGPADQLARLMAALTTQLGCAPDGAGLVRSLRLQPGEVELRLAVPAHCAGAELTDTAFQTLRGLLPDTDIYVLPG